jgi:hypothetical protein
MVPADWKHPVDDRGSFIPLFEPEQYAVDAEHYRLTKAVWNDVPGARAEYALKYDDRTVDAMIRYRDDGGSLETSRSANGNCSGWINPAPVREDYMPDWLPHQRTHFCLYECTTEGTPLSPVFATIEELEAWRKEEGE